jgi:hypothetical protein
MLGDAYKSSALKLKAQINYTHYRDISCTENIPGSLLAQNLACSVVRKGEILSNTIVLISEEIFVSRAPLTAGTISPNARSKWR